MKLIVIDIETKSDKDIMKSGVYAYADSPYFDILLFSYSVDTGAVQVIDLANGEKIPDEILKAFTDENIIKQAFNVNFERVCLSAYVQRNYPQYFKDYGSDEDTVGNYFNPVSWHCTMIHSRYLSLPSSLAEVGRVLKIQEQKMTEGKSLIKFFCVPSKTDDSEPEFHNPVLYPDKLETFKAYNKRDVEAEMEIDRKLAKYPVPDFVWEEFYIDQKINDRGIRIDLQLAQNAIALDEHIKAELSAEMCRLTGVENPNSVYQLLKWLEEQGYSSASLGKEEVAELIKTAEEPVRSVLSLRQQLAKSSVKKYTAMTNMVCSDDRARGTFSFYGASRTGRFSGRNIQLQNLPQNHIPDLAGTREIIRNGDFELAEMLFDNIPDILSQLIRTALIPKDGYKFIVADFNSIEARTLAWLAGETWRMQAFARGDDIYCASASKMFGVPVVKHGINGHLRQKGKVAELACIAEGQLVLTNHGLIPIEKVTINDKVWDGESWVEHDGVIYKGEREIITYEGLTATPDHLVWVEGKSRPVQFGIAAASGSHLIQTGNGRQAVRLGEDYQSGETLEQGMESLLCADKMCGMQFCPVDTADKSHFQKIKGLSALFQAETDSVMAGQETDSSKTAVRKSERCRLSQLWCEGDSIQVLECHSGWAVPYPDLRTAGKSNGDRPYKQQRRLCPWKSSLCDPFRKRFQPQGYSIVKVRAEILAVLSECCCPQTFCRNDTGRDYSGCRKSSCRKTEELAADIRKARLYDIRNAGRHHRFTVSGKLVHNCGYGGSIGAMKAMGGSAMGLSDSELKKIVTDWRVASPNIVKLWYAVDDAAMTAVVQKTTTQTHGIKFIYQNGILFVELPSKRRLAYIRPQIDVNRFGGDSLTYEGVGTTKKWERLETYGSKIVENIVQGIARDLLCHSMKTLSHCFMVATVHDEIIIEANKYMSVETVCKQMAEIPDWAEGLILRADGFECAFYQKD